MWEKNKSRNASGLPLISAGGDLARALRTRLDVHLDDLERHAATRTRKRLRHASFIFTILFLALTMRLFQLTTGSDEQAVARALHPSAPTSTAQRPAIYDRNGTVLATHIATHTLGADPRMIADAERATQALVEILPALNKTRTRRLLATNRHYVELKRGLTPRQYKAVLSLGNPALLMHRDEKRVYPHGSLVAHIVGYASSDNRGLAGLELAYDHDALPVNMGEVVRTTIDIGVQYAVRSELLKAMHKYRAIGGAAIVMDVHNGDILAMVSLPDFDANHPTATPEQNRFNRVVQGTYELGSIFKIFTAAMVLQAGTVTTDQLFQTTTPLQFGKYFIRDMRPKKKPLTVHEIIVHSSNVGAGQLAMSVGPETHRHFWTQLGLLDAPLFELPETAAPQRPERWGDIYRATMSYGHGISISPLQAVAAGATMVNGGIYYTPRLMEDGAPVGTRVIDQTISYQVQEMMRAVVTQGTARKANAKGYGVMGKTGTAEKQHNGGYAKKNKNITSFLGAFPAHEPRFAFLVTLDEPQPLASDYNHAEAGWNAAPVGGEIVKRIAPLLDIYPQYASVETDAANDAHDTQAAVYYEGEGL